MSSILQMLLLLSQNYFTTLSGHTTGFVNIWTLLNDGVPFKKQFHTKCLL